MSTVFIICLCINFILFWDGINSECPYVSTGAYAYPIGPCSIKSTSSTSGKWICVDENEYFPTGNLVPALVLYVAGDGDCTGTEISPNRLNISSPKVDFVCNGTTTNVDDCELVSFSYTPCDGGSKITNTFVANLCPENGLGLNCKSGSTLESRTQEDCGGNTDNIDYDSFCNEYLGECPSGVDEESLWEIAFGDTDITPLITVTVVILGVAAVVCIIGCCMCRISYSRAIKKLGTRGQLKNSIKPNGQQPAVHNVNGGRFHAVQQASTSVAFVAIQPQPQPQPQTVVVVPQPQIQQPIINASAPIEDDNDNVSDVSAPLAPGWQKLKGGDGKVYYQNTATKAIQWEKPIANGDGAEGGGGGTRGGNNGTNGNHFV